MDIKQFNENFTVSQWTELLQTFGIRYFRSNKNTVYFTRSGKQNGTSVSIFQKDNIWFLHNFSDNVNFQKTSNNKDTYSPFEFILQNRYNGDFAKCCNDLIGKIPTQTGTTAFKSSQATKDTNETNITQYNELLYLFSDERAERETVLLQIEKKLQRFQADCIIAKKYPNINKKRVYRCAINRSVINKNINPKTLEAFGFYDEKNKVFVPTYNEFTTEFENKFLTLDLILNFISKGYSIYPAHLQADENGIYKKVKSNFLVSELIMLDIDGTTTIDEILSKQNKGLIAIYTSVNHTKEVNRFRLIFELPFVVKSQNDYEYILQKFINNYGADVKCKDSSRGYFGNNNAIIYNFIDGTITEYNNGVPL